jgi:high-affinity nickel-transport protein
MNVVGAVVGVSISSTFLLILAVVNGALLWSALRKRRKVRNSSSSLTISCRTDNLNMKVRAMAVSELALGSTPMSKLTDFKSGDFQDNDKEMAIKLSEDSPKDEIREDDRPQDVGEGLLATSCIARCAKPILKLIDTPWKMYPVGFLFGLGFDTASEIALLGISALAATSSTTNDPIPASQILLLPLIFTAGMTFVDSCDSIFMLHAYALPYRGAVDPGGLKGKWWKGLTFFEQRGEVEVTVVAKERRRNRLRSTVADEDLVNVSIVLTILSIGMALLISIVGFMGLAAEQCKVCAKAATEDPGLGTFFLSISLVHLLTLGGTT